MAGKLYSMDQVSGHNSANDLWIIVDGTIFDVTQFQKEHPGVSHPNTGPCGRRR